MTYQGIDLANKLTDRNNEMKFAFLSQETVPDYRTLDVSQLAYGFPFYSVKAINIIFVSKWNAKSCLKRCCRWLCGITVIIISNQATNGLSYCLQSCHWQKYLSISTIHALNSTQMNGLFWFLNNYFSLFVLPLLISSFALFAWDSSTWKIRGFTLISCFESLVYF